MQVLREEGPCHGKAVRRNGSIVLKHANAWSASVHSFLRHLEQNGFEAAPKVVGSGFDAEGNETLTYIDGDILDELPLTETGAHQIGLMLKKLHQAAATYVAPASAVWRPWCGRDIGSSSKIIGHCDVAPWNIISKDGMPIALIDWDYSGPVDAQVDLAQACWLNAKLHDDVVARNECLPPISDRAKLLRTIVQGYELPSRQRRFLVGLMTEFAVYSAASEADEADIQPKSDYKSLDRNVIWAMAWRSRAAAWMLRHRRILENALV